MFGFSGARQWVYPMAQPGRFQRWHTISSVALHLILFVTPWITVAGNPALRIDLPGRRVFVLGGIYTARDSILLLLILLFLAFALFFFTSLWGRIWCGYACPQTVFLESWIRPIEKWIEGDRGARMRRDKGGISLDYAWRKAAKWSLFALAAFVIAMAFIAFFAGARELWTGRAGVASYTLVGIITVALFWDFAWFREQFCNYLCPYARFQGALTDEESLLIAYDRARGEPRGGPLAKTDGRCVECNKCVAVCPQGIDIRNGFQLECIACGHCIDACTDVMGKLGHPTLVRYSTIAADEGRKVRRLRPRTVVYGGLLGGIAATWIALVAGHVPFEATVNRMPGSLFTIDTDGAVRNTFLLRIENKSAGDGQVPFHVHVTGLPGAQVICDDIRLASTEDRIVPLVVRVPRALATDRTIPIQVHVTSPTDSLVLGTTFKSGGELHDERQPERETD